MTARALANDIQFPAAHAIPEVPPAIARSADRAADAAHLLDNSKLAEPCRACAARGGCHATRLMAMMPGHTASPRLHSRTLSQGEHVFYEGAELKAVYAVKAGSVKTYLTGAAGDEQVVSFHFPGELLSLDALGTRLHGSSVMALENTVVCAVHVAHLEEYIRHSTGGLRWFLGLAAEEIVRHHHTSMLTRSKAEVRLSYFLLDLSMHFRGRGNYAHEFTLNMSRQDIGNHLGLAIETVSRLMTRFQRDGLLEVDRRRITIRDAAALGVMAKIPWRSRMQ